MGSTLSGTLTQLLLHGLQRLPPQTRMRVTELGAAVGSDEVLPLAKPLDVSESAAAARMRRAVCKRATTHGRSAAAAPRRRTEVNIGGEEKEGTTRKWRTQGQRRELVVKDALPVPPWMGMCWEWSEAIDDVGAEGVISDWWTDRSWAAGEGARPPRLMENYAAASRGFLVNEVRPTGLRLDGVRSSCAVVRCNTCCLSVACVASPTAAATAAVRLTPLSPTRHPLARISRHDERQSPQTLPHSRGHLASPLECSR